MQRIEAALLIPGRGAPVTDAVVTLDGATIAYAGAAGEAPPHAAGDSVISAPVMLPGLWGSVTGSSPACPPSAGAHG
jgi:hypothetical protein